MKNNYPDLSDSIPGRLLEFGAMVEESADRLGLVARRDLGRLYSRHFQECLAPPFLERIPNGTKVLDVGSGGGFPGIPLAILREDITSTLVEPRHRKAAFLERVILSLGLAKTTVFLGSIEELGRLGRDPEFEIVISRSLRWTPEMIQGMDRVLRPEGLLLRFGSARVAKERVPVHPLAPGSERAVQVWDRNSWGDLPKAS